MYACTCTHACAHTHTVLLLSHENEVNPATDIFAKAIEAAQENYRNSLSTENTPDTLIAAIQEALRQEELRRASTQYGVALERNPLTGKLWIPYGKRNS